VCADPENAAGTGATHGPKIDIFFSEVKENVLARI
jgi:hypothetical protein